MDSLSEMPSLAGIEVKRPPPGVAPPSGPAPPWVRVSLSTSKSAEESGEVEINEEDFEGEDTEVMLLRRSIQPESYCVARLI